MNHRERRTRDRIALDENAILDARRHNDATLAVGRAMAERIYRPRWTCRLPSGTGGGPTVPPTARATTEVSIRSAWTAESIATSPSESGSSAG